MIFVDSNVPMYLIGADHPNKERARAVIADLVGAGARLVTDAEVFQELLHRYTAIHRTDAIDAAWQVLEAIVDEILPVEFADVETARELIATDGQLGARDALHAAIMRRSGIARIFSFDHHFDAVDGIVRLG